MDLMDVKITRKKNCWNFFSVVHQSILLLMVIQIISKGKPKVTPYIIGRVFFIPKLNAEYEAIKLFGPGENAAAEQNKMKAIKSEGIIKVYAICKPFLVG